MKIHSLKIHNIASITDALIDFDAEPLASSEVFLISGPTGAGKSTLLDSICLALFDTTPRLIARGAGVKDNSGEMAYADPRQMLRRNTGEGFVALEYTANDSHRYCATWSVQRARKKTSGRMQPSVRNLRRLSDGMEWSRKGEIDEVISAATGLDFNRFCRTSMLAQGDFTRFLFCEDKEKAIVLEKLMNADIYSRIGVRIFENAKLHRDNWQRALEQAEAIRSLTPDERLALEKRRQELRDSSEKLEAASDAVHRHLEHLRRVDALREEVKRLRQKLAFDREMCSSEAMNSKRRMVDMWSESADARADILAVDDADKTVSDAMNSLKSCRTRYDALSESLATLERNLSSSIDRRDELKRLTALEPLRRALMDDSAVIVAELEKFHEKSIQLADARKAILSLSRLIDSELRPAAEKESKLLHAAVDIVDETKSSLDNERRLFDSLGDTALRAERDRCVAHKAYLLAASEAMARLAMNTKADEKLHSEIADASKRLVDARKMLSEAKERETAARRMLDTAQTAHNLEMKTIEDFSRQIRSSLTVGCTCPVCMQTVKAMPPAEQIIDNIARDSRLRFEAVQKAASDASAEVVRISELVAVLVLKADRSQEVSEMTVLLGRLKSELDSCLQKCGLAPSTSSEDLSKAIDDTDKTICDLALRIDNADKQQAVVRALEVRLDSAQLKLNEVRNRAHEADKKLNDSVSRCEERMSALRREDDANASSLRQVLQRLEACPEWSLREGEDLPDLASRIKLDAARHKEMLNQLHSLEVSLPCEEAVISGCKACRESCGDMPETGNAGKVEQKCTVAAWNSLCADISEARTKIAGARSRRDASVAALDVFLSAHPEYTRDTLRMLASQGPLYISGLQQELRAADDTMLKSRSALASALWEIRKAQTVGYIPMPVLPEGFDAGILPDDPLPRASSVLAGLSDALKKLSAEIGAVGNELNRSAELEKQKADLMSRADELHNVFIGWDNLDRMFGSADGSKMRRIALSYVLGALIRSANRFMATLSDRYTLSVEPGSFIINVEDAWQGYAVRPASTVSGGESFLVSLALALALSDIGDRQGGDILFIDEGFGSLSGEPLQSAVSTLQRLHSVGGRRVGIISHIEELKNRIPVQIQLEQKRGGGSAGSSVSTVTL